MASRSASQRSDVCQLLNNGQLPFSDVLRFFNNPINEEQAWAVCYQCAQFYLREQSQERYQDLYEYGLQSVCLNLEGEVLIRCPGPNGSGKGPPGGEYYPFKKCHATEHDAVKTLGRIIFEALDYGIGEAEERPLSHGLERLIDTMTRSQQEGGGGDTDTESQSADDEGIEKDSGEDHLCAFRDVARLCTQHLSSRQDANYHYRAVCRALLAEAVELQTFLEKIAHSRERLQHQAEDQDTGLLELERDDWARLWMQVMRSLRQGVRLKKHEHQVHHHHPPVEYELTPFEMLLEDIRSRRYTLHKIMVNGDIPPKVKNDAHAVILDFIRSRPPLRQVKNRKLKSLPPKPPDPHERLLQDIRAQPKLKPVKDGRLLVETSRTRLHSEDSPPPARKLIKPDFNLLLTNSFEESEEDSEIDSPDKGHCRHQRKYSPLSSPATEPHNMNATWFTSPPGTSPDSLGTKLQRRHTIMVCESPTDAKLALQELPPLEEEEEPSPSEEQTPRLQRGSDSPLSGLPDHTLHNGHLLRGANNPPTRHQGALYRSEHRRSLTSGLTAIPEVEDDSGGGGSGGGASSAPCRRHSMPAAPHRHGVGGFSVCDSGGGVVGGGGGVQSRPPPPDGRHRRKGRDESRRSLPAPLQPPPSSGDASAVKEGEGGESGGDLGLLTASQMMHFDIQKRWQNPIECLSLTLEEVTHIRSVLTKAELESLISHADLYTLVAKNKVCFTCKTTRFTLFGEWGTKCKFCKRTVCSKCMRKMHVPTEHFKNIPVYTLSPTPITKEAETLIQNYVKSNAVPSPASSTAVHQSESSAVATATTTTPTTATQRSNPNSLLEQQKGKRPLQRSQSMTLPTKKPSSASSPSQPQRRPLMSICCDCKGMIMEIIRASKTSLAMLQPSGGGGGAAQSCSSTPLSSPSSQTSSPSSSC